MSLRSFHSSAVKKSGTKLWSDFSSRAKALSIGSERIRKCILEGTPAQGPPSIKRRANRVKYSSPEKIDQAFKTCYEFLETRAASKHAELQHEENAERRTQLAIEAEIHNPEVLYNFQFNAKIENDPKVIDYNLPVYRQLGRNHWESYGQMLLMQRLETLAVIPDTLATLKPLAEVHVRFPFSTGVNKWIEPGELLSSNATSLPPAIKIQEYDDVDPQTQRYTILVVNPDEPDVTSDSFKTTLQYGLTDLKLSYNDNIIDPRKFSDENELAEYLPPVPEKNAGVQRFAVWVFRQTQPYANENKLFDRRNFDLRAFVSANKLQPIGAHLWRSTWDSNVANVRAKYALPEGRVFHRVRKA